MTRNKPKFIRHVFTLGVILSILQCWANINLKWSVETSRLEPAVFEAVRGETLRLEAALKSYGTPLELTGKTFEIFYQTNRMGSSWWRAPATVTSNRVTAVFTPAMDPGAPVVHGFLGSTGEIYRAAFTIRFRPGPGASPNEIPLPAKTLDFSTVELVNIDKAPWATEAALSETAAAASEAQKAADAANTNAAEALSLATSVSSIVIGDDCQLVSTNYNSASKMPSLFLRFKIKNEATGSNEWKIVWNEITRWNWLLDDYFPANFYGKPEIDKALEEKADRAWGHYDSHTGNYAPDGYTWISSPSIAIAGGLAYQRVMTAEGAIWILQSNGMTTFTGGATNGYFRISDDKGNAIFEITKGSERVEGANAGQPETSIVNGITHMFIPYSVEAAEHPKLAVCTDLTAADWKTEGDEGFPFNVAWSGVSGAYVAEVWPNQPCPCLFVQATYKLGAQDVISHKAPMEVSKMVIAGKTYTVSIGTATVDGSTKKVLVLE